MDLVITVNAAWNVWNFRRALVEGLLADGHSLTVLAPRDDAAEPLEALGCRCAQLDMDVKGLNPASDLGLFLRLRRDLRQRRPDAILGFTVKNNIYGALAARRFGIPFVPNVTGLGTAFLSGGLVQSVAEALYRAAFKKVPVVFFQNPDDGALFVGRGLVREAQARLLPGSGIDLDRFAPAPMPNPGEPPVFLMIGRLLRDKGTLEFVEAARRVKSVCPSARFLILGETGSENRSAIDPATVAAWQAEGVIEYLGRREDVRPSIAGAACVVLPSYREGAPRTLIEAAAMARPVIATDVPGCRSVVEDGGTGFLCRPRSAESLAAACARFIALAPEARAAMGRAGRAKMEREFDQRIVLAAYREILAALPRPR